MEEGDTKRMRILRSNTMTIKDSIIFARSWNLRLCRPSWDKYKSSRFNDIDFNRLLIHTITVALVTGYPRKQSDFCDPRRLYPR